MVKKMLDRQSIQLSLEHLESAGTEVGKTRDVLAKLDYGLRTLDAAIDEMKLALTKALDTNAHSQLTLPVSSYVHENLINLARKIDKSGRGMETTFDKKDHPLYYPDLRLLMQCGLVESTRPIGSYRLSDEAIRYYKSFKARESGAPPD